MKRAPLLLAVIMFTSNIGYSFCGFYVAKADIKLFNKSSQVIIAKNGDRQTVTMSSDFEGEVKDFAMVVPVPVVLQEKDIKTVNKSIFTKLDDYSAPRLVEYYDQDPCYVERYYEDYPMAMADMEMSGAVTTLSEVSLNKYQVTIEAQYEIGNYDIL